MCEYTLHVYMYMHIKRECIYVLGYDIICISDCNLWTEKFESHYWKNQNKFNMTGAQWGKGRT